MKHQKEEPKTETATSNVEIPSWVWWIPAGLVVALLALAIVFRRRIRGYLLLRSLRNSPEFGKTYHRLMKLLASYGYVRESSETLRHFSARVDADLTTSEFSRLTKMYETQLYSKNLTEKVIAAEETQLVQQIIARLTK